MTRAGEELELGIPVGIRTKVIQLLTARSRPSPALREMALLGGKRPYEEDGGNGGEAGGTAGRMVKGKGNEEASDKEATEERNIPTYSTCKTVSTWGRSTVC